MENYCQAKYHIFKLQDSEDFTILNANDPYFEEEEKLLTSQCIAFKVDGPVKRGAYCEAGQIYENIFSATPQHVCAVADLKILGKHNIENVLAAVAMTRAFNIPLEIVKKEVQAFMGVAHRIEYVATKKGVNFYNDSKATNVDAAIRGLVAMPSNVRLIGGGMDKKTSFKEWIAYFPNKVSKLYLIGETAEQIIEECKGIGFTEIEKFKSLEEATQKAYEDAQSGECILLSPACASWDMFESYEQRGEIFKEVVSQLEG
jgi:UDP-N-acetylmuramoylalanine--D-glutamate ligase